MDNPEHHYHFSGKGVKSIYLCIYGQECKRQDSYDIFGNVLDLLDYKSEFKVVLGFKEGRPIPKNARYLATVSGADTVHYYEIREIEYYKENKDDINNTKKSIT